MMEFVGGNSLHGYLKSKPNRRLDEREARRIFKQVLGGIDYCHSKCITHRDIKLENLLLDDTGQIKIIDFGFSTCIPNDRKIKIFCGTPSYMAPEIVQKTEYAGPPADMWALGVLLYALLHGCFPFRGQNDKELYKKICRGEFKIGEHVSNEASDLLSRLLEVDANIRISAREVCSHYWIQGVKLTNRPASTTVRSQDTSKTRTERDPGEKIILPLNATGNFTGFIAKGVNNLTNGGYNGQQVIKDKTLNGPSGPQFVFQTVAEEKAQAGVPSGQKNNNWGNLNTLMNKFN